MLLVVALFVAACTNGARPKNLSTDTNSREISDQSERIEFLSTYLAIKSEITDTEFDIFYADNSGGRMEVPGPSDWNMKVVVRLKDPATASMWTQDWQEMTYVDADDSDLSAWDEVERDKSWETNSEPRYYSKNNSLMIVYETEGIIYYRVRTT